MKKKLFGTALFLLAFFSACLIKVSAAEFSDVPKDSVRYGAINALTELGVISGDARLHERSLPRCLQEQWATAKKAMQLKSCRSEMCRAVTGARDLYPSAMNTDLSTEWATVGLRPPKRLHTNRR